MCRIRIVNSTDAPKECRHKEEPDAHFAREWCNYGAVITNLLFASVFDFILLLFVSIAQIARGTEIFKSIDNDQAKDRCKNKCMCECVCV